MHAPVVPQTSPLGQPEFVAVLCPFGVGIDVVKDVRLVPPLRMVPPKLPVLLLKMAAVEFPVAVKLPLLSAKAGIVTVMVFHFRFSFCLKFLFVTPK